MRLALRIMLPLLAAGVAAGAFAEDFPRRKSGLWEVRTSTASAGANTAQAQAAANVQLCVDEKMDNAVQQQAAGMAKQSCSKQEIKKSSGQIVVDSVCKFGNTTATTHSVFTGSFDTAYRVQTRSTYDPPMAGTKEGEFVIDAKWLGPCKADQRPGDMILGNGMKINMHDAQGAARPARK